MKIGILTFIDTLNYGALLQSYALQVAITKMGHEVELIQYKNDFIEKREKNKNYFSIRWLLRTFVIGNNIKRKARKIADFESIYVNKGGVFDVRRMRELSFFYDKIIVGSDQVWNLDLTGGDLHYFLDFVVEPEKKIAYAPSFGESSVPNVLAEKIGNLLRDFYALSVREKSGVSIISNLSGREAKVVIDPTLLLSKEDWQRLMDIRPCAKPYILVYLPHKKDLCFEFARKLQTKTGFQIVYLSISPRIIAGVKTIYDASPQEWLSWIYHADYVITGSFHGTAFSLNFEKQFFYESLGKGSRIDNLISLTGTSFRDLCNNADLDGIIDYTQVRGKLLQARQDSLLWLAKSINNDIYDYE